VLGRIVAEARERVANVSAEERRAAERAATAAPPAPSFTGALRRADVAVIAEVKRRSPSKGEINGALAAGEQARAYEQGGASACSILTEPRHFAGSLADLEEARSAVTIPLLRTDFLVDVAQLFEARAAGASAALLIARALAPAALRELVVHARAIGLEPLVEVRDEAELGSALEADATVIGVNSRDLETLLVEPQVTERVLRLIPMDRIAVAESGVSGRAEVERAALLGADAVLVGSAISAAPDPVEAVRALTGVQRVPRAG
jgi:indole-3-glycerol phosphate synthase